MEGNVESSMCPDTMEELPGVEWLNEEVKAMKGLHTFDFLAEIN